MWVVFTTTSARVSLVTQDCTTVFTAVSGARPHSNVQSRVVSFATRLSVCLFVSSDAQSNQSINQSYTALSPILEVAGSSILKVNTVLSRKKHS